MKNFSVKYLLLASSLLLLAFLALFTIKIWYPKTQGNADLAELIKLVGNSRITEARLSGGFAYAPYKPLPKTEKRKYSDFELTKGSGKRLISESIVLSNDEIKKDEMVEDLEVGKATVKSSKRGIESIDYQNLINIDLSSQFPNLIEGTFFRGEPKQEYSFSNKGLKITQIKDFELVRAKIVIADRKNTLETTHALALVYAIEGNFKEAIAKLEKANAEECSNPYILNDLAVAYFNYAHEKEDLLHMIKALSVIDKALAKNKKIEEVLFNRALILGSLQLTEAEKAWNDYLKLEKDVNWRKEAQNHLVIIKAPTLPELWVKERKTLEKAVIDKNTELAKKIINKFPHFARMQAINELIPAWGEAYLQESYIESMQSVEIAKFIGESLQIIHNDNLVYDIVYTINTSLEQSNTEQTKKLANAYIAHKQGEHLTETGQVDQAEASLLKAKKLFVECRDLAGKTLTDIQLARIYVFRANFPIALDVITKFRKVAEDKQYLYVLGRSWLTYGRIQHKLFEPQKALEALKVAEKYFKEIGDYNEILNTYSLLAIVHEQIGLLEGFWESCYKAFKLMREVNNATYKITINNFITERLFERNTLNISLYFLDQSFYLCQKSKAITDLFSVLCFRAQANYKLGNKNTAYDDINRAKACVNLSSEESVKIGFEQYIAVLEGAFSLFEEPKKAISLYNVALASSYGEFEKYELVSIYLSRAKAYILIGEYDKAEKDLESSIKEYERVRNSFPFEKERVSFLEQVLSSYDEMILFQMEKRKRADLAFYYNEAKRTRALLDLIAINQKINHSTSLELTVSKLAPYSLRDIQSKIPENTVVVEYAFLERKLLIWLVERNDSKFFQVEVDQNLLEKDIKNFRDAIDRNLLKNELTSFSAPLFEKLIKPILMLIPKETRVVIVPDKILYEVPFTALINSSTNNFLIEDFVITIVPSSTIFITSLQQNKQLSKIKTPKILLVGNPAFDRKRFPRLGNLLHSEKEVDSIAKLYPKDAIVFKNKTATKKVFLDFAPKSNIIHFAGHAIANLETPLSSELIFAKNEFEEFNDSSLRAYELYDLHLTQTQLVVLAGCNTAKGQRLQSEGVISITRPFLASNVPAVIASLWEADDWASEVLFSSFYKNIVSGKDAGAALRNAQLDLINSSDSKQQQPKKWAVFTLFGGVNQKEK
ncbi:MAG: CHAT domain-containing protein [Acidobacteria bacterium]|nr:CHAT domain-containing protein [Acidobacteriota bacterium]